MLQVAVVSTFYPNPAMPLRTLFVRNLVVALAQYAGITVVAPIPYAPPFPARPIWTRSRSVPKLESRDSLSVHHPRFLAIPGVAALNGWHYCWAVLPSLWSLLRSRKLDVIHVHCAYPDAVGVALAARILRVPFVVTAHGSDINVYASRPLLRRQLRWALRRASTVIAVSASLRRKLTQTFPEISDRVEHVPCAGADPQLFRPLDREASRRELGLPAGGRIVLFIGQLVRIKRADLLLQAWRALLARADCGANDRLLLIGEGPLRAQLEGTAANAEFRGTVRFLGGVPQAQIARWLNAADVLCLASDNEGTPNVVVESLSVGRPVVATAVGGVPELITPGVNGVLATPGDSGSLAQALAHGLTHPWDSRAIAAGMAGFSWQSLAERNLTVLMRAAGVPEEVAHASDQ